MICLICRHAEMIEGLTSISFARGGMQFGVNHVPARICPRCGEAYVDEVIAVKLLREAEEISEAGIRDVLLEFKWG